MNYDVSSLQAHLDRRASLYRSLGLIPLAIRGSKVLEVAAGSGQNSLYLAAQEPAQLVLVEPNPTGAQQIEALYKDQPLRHTPPQLIRSKLEDYRPESSFDIVICENWLGSSEHERALLRRLGGFVAARGVLVSTAVSPVGLMPNMLRRALAVRLLQPEQAFTDQTQALVAAFAPHLRTLGSMTRKIEDWVHDNMLNPAYFDLCLPVPVLVQELDPAFEVIGANPQFAQDWRWFKSLHGGQRRFNARFIEEYFANCHNLIDYRLELPRGDTAANRSLENVTSALIDKVRDFESCHRSAGAQLEKSQDALLAYLSAVADIVRVTLPAPVCLALEEGISLLRRPTLDAAAIAAAERFGSLFGRETLYVSLQRVVS